MKAQVLAAVLVFAPASAWAQGAIVETLEELRAVPEPPETRGPMPEKVDLSSGIPPPRSQGATSTCVSWAATYAAASHALRRSGGNVTLSPAYTYNLVSGNRFCHVGTSISKTLDFLRESGGLPIEEFAFDGGWCGRIPRDDERRPAASWRLYVSDIPCYHKLACNKRGSGPHGRPTSEFTNHYCHESVRRVYRQ